MMREPGQVFFEAIFGELHSWRETSEADRKGWAEVEATVRADERERCAQIADGMKVECEIQSDFMYNGACHDIAAAIRAKSAQQAS
jgi:primosomal replication protein N